jgi:Raf kinase inhibitor-like YbhB/YbcL family protein
MPITMFGNFGPGTSLDKRFTCDGAGSTPRPGWASVPARTAELVLVVTDPDAPGGRFVQWTAYGIPPTAHFVPTSARSGRNSAGKTGWAPACPPPGSGRHRYVFDVYALGRHSGLPAGAAPARVIAAVRGAIASGQVEALYGPR